VAGAAPTTTRSFDPEQAIFDTVGGATADEIVPESQFEDSELAPPVQLAQCQKDTGGTCNVGSCDASRGHTECKGSIGNYKCLCKGNTCATKGVCLAPPPPPPPPSGASTSPWGAAYSGGGWRALGGSIGFARALWDAKITPKLNTISSVSGGSWFTTQYVFSKKFFDAVNSEQPSKAYGEWINDYYKMLCKDGDSSSECQQSSTVTNVAKAISSLAGPYQAKELSQLLGAASRARFVWERFIDVMLDQYDPTITSNIATPQNRKGQLAADLLVCSALVGSGSIMSSGGPTELLIDTAKAPPLVPVAWQVPPSGSKAKASWFSPQYSTASMDAISKGYFSDAQKKLDLTDPPNVGKIAAMSSAAAAVLGTSSMIAPFAEKKAATAYNWLAGKAADVAADAAQTVLNHANLQGMAVCSGKNEGTKDNMKCKYPSVRLTDGGYADDSSIATNVANMQNAFQTSTVLKIVALDSNNCVSQDNAACPVPNKGPTLVPGTPLAVSQNYNWGSLFKGDQARGAMLNMNNQIFADSFKEKADITGQHIGNASSRVTISHGIFTTIKNDRYGVKAGSKVEMLVVHINSPQSTALINQGAAHTKTYTDLAQSTYEALKHDKTFEKFFAGKSLLQVEN